jgi:hypothetical protein
MPKLAFFRKVKEVFNYDLQQMFTGMETNVVPRGTSEDMKGKVYTDLIEGKTEYILQHRRFLDEYQVVPKEIIRMLSQSASEKGDIEGRYKALIQELKNEIAELRGRKSSSDS